MMVSLWRMTTLQKHSSQLEVRRIKHEGSACRGIVSGGSDHRRQQAVVAKSSYSVDLAVSPTSESPADLTRLFSQDDDLPCHKSIFLSMASNEQQVILLCFSVLDGGPYLEDPYPLTEVAIHVPASQAKDAFIMKASITSEYAMRFALLAEDGQCLISIDYSIDGLATIESSCTIAAITPTFRKKWLPKSFVRELLTLQLYAMAMSKVPCSANQIREPATVSIQYNKHTAAWLPQLGLLLGD